MVLTVLTTALFDPYLSRVLLYGVYTVYTEEANGEWIPCNYSKLALLVVLNAHHFGTVRVWGRFLVISRGINPNNVGRFSGTKGSEDLG